MLLLSLLLAQWYHQSALIDVKSDSLQQPYDCGKKFASQNGARDSNSTTCFCAQMVWTTTTKGYLWGFRPSWWFLTFTNFTKTITECYNYTKILLRSCQRNGGGGEERLINLDSARPPSGRPHRGAWRRTLELLLLPPHSSFTTHLCAHTTL